MTSEPEKINITVEFSGGLELLFSNQHHHKVTIPSHQQKTDEKSNTTQGPRTTIRDLVTYLCDEVMKDPRRDLFVLDGTVRPGILVLINDTDWELEGEDAYEIKEGDAVLFVSTLHGG
ncbi:ubiquitin related modifier 1 [Periconia macrospinosa]|uniref:Ubiquitin-related modifier 1 n=1 Tax=Periconia macrospinosa TaxID=97972 RepID=A0A2V1DSM6_9PLEO|nr:ubiquitin related modifier 1 [Periconia macrospinosa]